MLPYARNKRLNLSFPLWFIPTFILLCGLLLINSTTPTPVSADADFVEIFNAVGNYAFVADGIGTRGDPDSGIWTGSGTITLDIPASATIHHARLVWTGRTVDTSSGDAFFDPDGVELSIDAGTPTQIMSNGVGGERYDQDPWFSDKTDDVRQVHESADVKHLVQPGSHDYTISDHEHGIDPNVGSNALNYGVGIWVVYEDVSVDPGQVIIFEGQDSFFRLRTPPRGPHSDVRCGTFPAATEPRLTEMSHFVSGVNPKGNHGGLPERRSTAFWYMSGSGAPPSDTAPVPGLILTAGANGFDPQGQYPLGSYSQLEWDNFTPAGIVVDAGDTWLCFQIESGDSTDLTGFGVDGALDKPASGMWNFFAIKLLSVPTFVDLISFTASADTDRNVALRWETGAETNSFGFNLYRSPNDNFASREKIHFEPSAVPGGTGTGAVYEYADVVPSYGQYYYWLEDVDTGGTIKLHAPLMVTVSPVLNLFLPFIVNQP